jgi:predicted metallopeptidase
MRKRIAKRRARFEWQEAPDIKARALELIKKLELGSVRPNRLFFYRSTGSKSRAYARTWGLPSLWQHALKVDPGYIIEVVSHHFDNLSAHNQDKVIIHELTHIPKTFSGALVPHTRRKKGSFHHKLDELIDRYFAQKL